MIDKIQNNLEQQQYMEESWKESLLALFMLAGGMFSDAATK